MESLMAMEYYGGKSINLMEVTPKILLNHTIIKIVLKHARIVVEG